MQTLLIKGEEYVLITRREYDRLTQAASTIPLPPLPEPDAHGNVPAVAYARASIAREIMRRMHDAGLKQSELAKLAGVPRETLNRILKCTRTPDEATVKRIEDALSQAETPTLPNDSK